MLERRVQLLVEPQIQVEQCAFHPCHGTLDQLYTLVRVLEGPWEFAQPVHMCFVDLENAYDRVPQDVLWGLLWKYGVDQNLVHIAGSKSDLFPVRVCFR